MFSNLNLQNLIGAVISGVLVAVVGYLGGVANIYEIDLKGLLNVAVLAAIASLLKAVGTTTNGNFLGIAKVK